jgi:Lipopolysaccharide kinase (Kdo/WaaP) family.
MKGWVKVEKKLFRGYLKIYHRPGDGKWVDLAFPYWQGELTSLTRIESSQSAVVHEGNVEALPCYFKRYLIRDFKDRIKHIIRPSRARRAMRGDAKVQSCGFNSPRVLCLIEERISGLLRQSALVTEAIKGAPSVSYWINQGFADSPELRQRFLPAFGHMAGAWHSKGLHHGDMRLGNILCRFFNGEFVFYWLDNERTKRYTTLPLSRRVNNLVQVNMEPGLSPMDRMELWNVYIEENDLSARQEKEVMRKVIRKTRKRWEKKGWICQCNRK